MECSESKLHKPDDENRYTELETSQIYPLSSEACGQTASAFQSSNDCNDAAVLNVEEDGVQDTTSLPDSSSHTGPVPSRGFCECPRSVKSPERSRRYLRSGMTPRANDISGSLSQNIHNHRNSIRYVITRSQGRGRIEQDSNNDSFTNVSMLENVDTEIGQFSPDQSTENRSQFQTLYYDTSQKNNFEMRTEKTGEIKHQGETISQDSKIDMRPFETRVETPKSIHDIPKHAARISAARLGHLKLNSSRNRWRSLENVKASKSKEQLGISNYRSEGCFHELKDGEAFEAPVSTSEIKHELVPENTNVPVSSDEDSDVEYFSGSEDAQSYLADSPKGQYLPQNILGLGVGNDTVPSSPSNFSEGGRSVFSYEETDSEGGDDNHYDSVLVAHSIVRPHGESHSRHEFSYQEDASLLALASPIDIDPFCPETKEEKHSSEHAASVSSPMVTPRSASSEGSGRDYPRPKTGASFAFYPRKKDGLVDFKTLFKSSSNVHDLGSIDVKKDFKETTTTPDLETPPSVAKTAWSNKNTQASSNTDEVSVQTPTVSKRQERRHSTNIDFRTMSSAFASAQRNQQQHQFSKSKLPWRVQASKARESVASLLSFTSSKTKDKRKQRPGLKDKKVPTQYFSEPAIGSSHVHNDEKTPTFSSTNERDIMERALVSHPQTEMDFDKESSFDSTNLRQQHSSFKIGNVFCPDTDKITVKLGKTGLLDNDPNRSQREVKERAYSFNDVFGDDIRDTISMCNDQDSRPRASSGESFRDGTKTRPHMSRSEECLLSLSYGFSEDESEQDRGNHKVSHLLAKHDLPFNHTPSCDLDTESVFKDDELETSDMCQSIHITDNPVTQSSGFSLPLHLPNNDNKDEKDKSSPWMSPNLRRTLKVVRAHLEKARSANQSPELFPEQSPAQSHVSNGAGGEERNNGLVNDSFRSKQHLFDTQYGPNSEFELKEDVSTWIISNPNDETAETMQDINSVPEPEIENDEVQTDKKVLTVNHKQVADERVNGEIKEGGEVGSNQSSLSTPSLSFVQSSHQVDSCFPNSSDQSESVTDSEQTTKSEICVDSYKLKPGSGANDSREVTGNFNVKTLSCDLKGNESPEKDTNVVMKSLEGHQHRIKPSERIDGEIEESYSVSNDETEQNLHRILQRYKSEPVLAITKDMFSSSNNEDDIYKASDNNKRQILLPPHQAVQTNTESFIGKEENNLLSEYEKGEDHIPLSESSLSKQVKRLKQKQSDISQNDSSDVDQSSCSSTETLHESPRVDTPKSQWDGFLPEIEERLMSVRKLHRSDSVSSISSGMSSISITSTRSEARGKKSSRRVDGLLSNQLFRKHLARHADTLEKRVLKMHKKGMRKALSNFDLSKEPPEEINNYLNLGDINNNNNNGDSDINITEDDSCKVTPRSEHGRLDDIPPTCLNSLTRSMSLCEKLLNSSQTDTVAQSGTRRLHNNQDDNHDITLTEHIPKTSSEIPIDLSFDHQNEDRVDLISSNDYPRPFKKAVSFTGLNVISTSEDVHVQTIHSTADTAVKRRFSDTAQFDKPFSRSERSGHNRMHIPSFKEFRNRPKLSSAQEPREKNEVEKQESEHPPPKIYVIKEDETDESLNNKTLKVTAEDRQPFEDAKSLTDEVHELKRKERISPRSRDSDTTISPRSVPVFMHPAITVTAGDVSRFKSKPPRHSMLNRSKSESNIKRRQQVVSTNNFLVPQTRDRSQTFSTRPGKSSKSSNLRSLERATPCESINGDSVKELCKDQRHVHLADLGLCSGTSNKEKFETRIAQNPTVIVPGESKFSHSGIQVADMDTQSYQNSDDGRTSEKRYTYGREHTTVSQTQLENKSDSFHHEITAISEPTTPAVDLYQFQDASDLRESLGFDLDPSLQGSGNVGQLDTCSWSKSLSASQLQYLHNNTTTRESVDFRGPDMQRKERQEEQSQSKVLFYLNKHDHQEFAEGNDTKQLKPKRSRYSREDEQNSVRALRLSDADVRCDDPGTVDTTLKDYGMLSNLTQRTSPTNSSSDSDQSCKNAVLRSTSDVSPVLSDERERRKRDRKDRPYKSDPFIGTDRLPQHSMYLDLHKDPTVSASCSFPSLEELAEHSDSLTCLYDDENESDIENGARKRRNRLSNLSSTSEDSGVAGHTLEDSLKKKQICIHCSAYTSDGKGLGSSLLLHQSVSDSGLSTVLACRKCELRRRERKETIQELAETEKRYGRDLNILKEEFYRPMKSTSLLTIDQLDAIFANLEELIHAHRQFMAKLTKVLVTAVDTEDEDICTVSIGSVFLQASAMFLAFEKYCVSQGQASLLLDQLIKERELLRVFLQVAQNENPKLRRMHLKTFLMVPVQRVMKYPLLLSRLYKVTPYYHSDKVNIRRAQENIEEILEQINAKTNIPGGMRKRPYDLFGYNLSDKIEVNRVAIDVLGWPKQNVCDVVTSRLWFGQLSEQSGWGTRKAGGGAKNVKFSLVHAALLTHGRPSDPSCPEYPLSPRDRTPVQQVAMVLVKEKAGRFQVIKDPLLMDRCVVTADTDYENLFEVHEQGKETYLFKGERSKETALWTRQLKTLCKNLGYWRRRRNGVPNIMLKAA